MRLKRIASIAQEEGITYRNAMRVLKRNRVKIYGTGEKKSVDANIAEKAKLSTRCLVIVHGAGKR